MVHNDKADIWAKKVLDKNQSNTKSPLSTSGLPSINSSQINGCGSSSSSSSRRRPAQLTNYIASSIPLENDNLDKEK